MDLCDRNTVDALLARHGFRFSRSKGQNFLTAAWVPREIAEAAGLDERCGVLEIGPGIGTLTAALCPRAGRVCALELDESLRPVLAETMSGFSNLTLRFGDVLRTDLPALAREEFGGLRPLVCANLPYNVTTPAIAALLGARCFEGLTLMVQREFAQRIRAEAGTALYSAFTVLCRYYAETEILFEVGAECFVPRPKVTSCVIRMTPRKEPPCGISDEALFFRVVRAAFAQRRKTLLNALSSAFGSLSRDELALALERCGLAPAARGETLDLAGFAALTEALAPLARD